ncbi:NUDIX hydrolase [Criblamydia sequanensis]|uniref:Nudix hydrolase n=1 Tax=Candidatus Criblamydia sequanensis CRIB-18 TaxID=1437425 RepID=A0A090D2D2_9BACT|nr:NUDIX domain-containing protein [Criblamydia sequanensis]CDR34233.1 Nudix hydrolase [Criblamydia sequanensis CRIB-18]
MDLNPYSIDARFALAVKPFYMVAYMVKIYDGKSYYLLLRRCGKHLGGNWQMISGGIKEGETAWQASLREINEENGITPDRLYSADALECFYEVSRDAIVMAPAFEAFVDTPSEITLSQSEHDAFIWVTHSEALNYLEFDNQKRIISHLETNFV